MIDGHKAYLKRELDNIENREVNQHMLPVFYVWTPRGKNSGPSSNEEK